MLAAVLVSALVFAIALHVLLRQRPSLPAPAAAAIAPAPPPPPPAEAAPDPELERAREVQRRMSPQGVVRVPGFAITGINQSVSACGGDWWSCHALVDGRVLLAVGDVTGHGMASALVAVLARGIVEGVVRASDAGVSPARVIATLAAALADLGDDRHAMTCAVAVLDPATGAVQLANAGHPFPYVKRRATGALEALIARGSPLGGAAPAVGMAKARLEPGDLLILCSDGVADRTGADGRRFGERRIRRLLSDPAADGNTAVRRLRTEFLAAVREFAADTDADDDLTLVICEYRADSLQHSAPS